MKTFIRFSLLMVVIFLQQISASGQYSVSTHQDQLKASVDMAQFHDPFAFTVKYSEAPHPTGKAAMRAYLRERKLEAQRQTPLRPDVTYQNRGVIPSPEILASFSGNSIITSTPLDNHLAVGPADHIVYTINVHMLVTNTV